MEQPCGIAVFAAVLKLRIGRFVGRALLEVVIVGDGIWERMDDWHSV